MNESVGHRGRPVEALSEGISDKGLRRSVVQAPSGFCLAVPSPGRWECTIGGLLRGCVGTFPFPPPVVQTTWLVTPVVESRSSRGVALLGGDVIGMVSVSLKLVRLCSTPLDLHDFELGGQGRFDANSLLV
jgi:hypothetical protein